MKLQKLIAMEMEAISGQDADLLKNVKFCVGRCGGLIVGGGYCGKPPTPPPPEG